jgi:hypothetical protein
MQSTASRPSGYFEVWESFSWEPIELRELDDLVIAVLHSREKGRGRRARARSAQRHAAAGPLSDPDDDPDHRAGNSGQLGMPG